MQVDVEICKYGTQVPDPEFCEFSFTSTVKFFFPSGDHRWKESLTNILLIPFCALIRYSVLFFPRSPWKLLKWTYHLSPFPTKYYTLLQRALLWNRCTHFTLFLHICVSQLLFQIDDVLVNIHPVYTIKAKNILMRSTLSWLTYMKISNSILQPCFTSARKSILVQHAIYNCKKK